MDVKITGLEGLTRPLLLSLGKTLTYKGVLTQKAEVNVTNQVILTLPLFTLLFSPVVIREMG